jgi:hypothetical protein
MDDFNGLDFLAMTYIELLKIRQDNEKNNSNDDDSNEDNDNDND